MDPENLLNLLIMTEEGKYAKKNRLNKEMASFMQEGVLKGVNLEQKQAFKSAMFSTVLNESVYMPVLHTLVPMKVGERFMLAEMWVDPDSEEGGERAEDGEPVVRGLIKFDISDVGFFDLFFIYSDYKIKLQLNYPEGLQGDSSKIEGQVKNILAQNGIKAEELYFGTSDTSISIEEAFPKIVEGRNTINVKI
jgi:hypothetical protein